MRSFELETVLLIDFYIANEHLTAGKPAKLG
jgi:hypothetical protein